MSEFDLDAGVLCLDFANTADWHASDQPQERLVDYPTLLAWAQAAGVLSAEQAARLNALAAQRPAAANAAMTKAMDLRESIYRIFSHVAAERPVDPVDLLLLNQTLQQAFLRLDLAATESGFTWEWQDEPEQLEQMLWPIARSAGDLLTGDQLDRLRECADDRGCGYLFVDLSRNRSRRWCSMASCGNRAKARRHYRRLQE